jgi:hypothetical protein
MSKRWTVLVLATLALSADRVDAASVPLASHRALYDITLARASPQSTIAQVSGRLVVEWVDTCDGFTTNQRMYTRLDNADGGSVASDLLLSSWEARDGKTFRFSMTNRMNGKIDEASRGIARTGAPGAKGSVEFEIPRAEAVDLPAGTIFPTAHMVALLEAAHAGQRMLSEVVFDGSAEDGLNDVSAYIGPKSRAKAAASVKGTRALASGESWPVRMAFFDHSGTDDFPTYEFAYRMFENGVSSELHFDYGAFAVKGTLTQIDPLPDAGCKDER